MVGFTKKRDKNASFFIDPIFSDSKKNDGPDNVERVYKSSESPKTIKKLETSADHDLGNILNGPANMNLINTPLLCQKDNSCGLSSNVCTDHRLFS